MTNLAAIVVLLALNGFFVAAEFSLVRAHGLRTDNLAPKDSAAARLAARIQANLEAYLATCQSGITMTSLGLGWAGEPAVAVLLKPLFAAMGTPDPLLHSVAFLLGFLLFSSLHIVIGGQLPKTFAIRRAEQVSIWVAYPLHVAYLLLWPLNWLLNKVSRGILSIFKAGEATQCEDFSDAAIEIRVSSSEDHDSFEQNESDGLHTLPEFEQHDVSRIMIPRNLVKVLDVAVSPEANQRIVMEFGYSRYPLIDGNNNDELLGMVLAIAVYRAIIDHDPAPWQRLDEFCLTPIIVLEKQNILQLFELMHARREHIALVANEYGSLCGIVTLQDMLQEIVGDVEAEFRITVPAAKGKLI